MDLIRWQDIYEVNIEEIDSQHKKLVALVNTMAQAMKAGKRKTVVNQVLKELVDYSGYHFQTEERILQQYDYPHYDSHKKMHDEMAMRAAQLKKKVDQGKGVVTAEVMLLLSDWLNKHIAEEDKKFGRYLNERPVPPA